MKFLSFVALASFLGLHAAQENRVTPAHPTHPPVSRAKSILPYLRWDTEAVVDEAIAPGKAGRIRYQGSHWPARCLHATTIIPSGQVVQVVGRQNITLLVELPTV